MLGRVVDAEHRAGKQAGHGGRIHNMSWPALLEQDRNEHANSVRHAPQIDAHHPLPIGDRTFPDRPRRIADARVVADHVHRAKSIQRLLGQGLHALALGDIGDHGQCFGAGPAQFGVGIGQCARLDIGQNDLHAFTREPLRHRKADPASRAGHDSNLVTKFLHF